MPAYQDRSRTFADTTRRGAISALGAAAATSLFAKPALGAAAIPMPLRGVIPVANTPYHDDGAINWGELAEEMRIYERCGMQGVIWPSAGSDLYFMTKDERLYGSKIVADACRPLDLACILTVHAGTTEEMLEVAAQVIPLEPDAIYVAPPSGDQPRDQLRQHFLALAELTDLPLVIFGTVNASPPLDLVIEIAESIPNTVYFRTDGMPVQPHISAAVAAKPPFKGVFAASAASRWLFELRLGVDGIMTDSGQFGDVMVHMQRAWDAGNQELAADIYSKLLLMANLDTRLLNYKEEQIPGATRYILKKRGWFSSAVARHRIFPTRNFEIKEIELSPEQRAEINARFTLLEPWLADAV